MRFSERSRARACHTDAGCRAPTRSASSRSVQRWRPWPACQVIARRTDSWRLERSCGSPADVVTRQASPRAHRPRWSTMRNAPGRGFGRRLELTGAGAHKPRSTAAPSRSCGRRSSASRPATSRRGRGARRPRGASPCPASDAGGSSSSSREAAPPGARDVPDDIADQERDRDQGDDVGAHRSDQVAGAVPSATARSTRPRPPHVSHVCIAGGFSPRRRSSARWRSSRPDPRTLVRP
jgi:hypothetical protein